MGTTGIEIKSSSGFEPPGTIRCGVDSGAPIYPSSPIALGWNCFENHHRLRLQKPKPKIIHSLAQQVVISRLALKHLLRTCFLCHLERVERRMPTDHVLPCVENEKRDGVLAPSIVPVANLSLWKIFILCDCTSPPTQGAIFQNTYRQS